MVGSATGPMAERNRFRAVQRLTRQRDFERIFARRCTAGDATLVVYVDVNGLGVTRLGIKTGKRLGNAAVRSRYRRYVREAFRIWQHELPAGVDILCIPKVTPDARITLQGTGASLRRLALRAHKELKDQGG